MHFNFVLYTFFEESHYTDEETQCGYGYRYSYYTEE